VIEGTCGGQTGTVPYRPRPKIPNNILMGVVTEIRIRIGSRFNDFVDPDPDLESGSMGKKNEEKMPFRYLFKYFYS
jgi:hypothetical protein